MQTPPSKTMARLLRTALAERDLAISHATALELVARQLGHASWNVLSAQGAPTIPSEMGQAADHGLPDGWSASGRSDLFHYGLQVTGGPEGVPALSIESRAPRELRPIPQAGEFLTIMQRISASPHRGSVVSFRAWMRCTQATGTGRIWIHARTAGRETTAFDNLGLEPGPAGPITATTNWTRRSVTIAVPDDAVYIGFGVLLGSGTGSFQSAGLSFGSAEEGEQPRPLPEAPRNLALLEGGA